MADLEHWHDRLASHFAKVASSRANAHPVFAFEHGLDQTEVAALQTDVREYIKSHYAYSRHWLPIVVYATEFGYRYAGWEYWQTFEMETPRWTQNERHAVRGSFLKFESEFRGFRPSGPWAYHFSIICWPISHAILPLDLQLQLAQVLSQLRGRLSIDLLRAPEDLAKLIATYSWQYSSRFAKLAQDTVLLGYIASALLEENYSQSRLLLPETLQRIATDVTAHRQARAWLNNAREAAHDARLKGLRSPRSTSPRESQAGRAQHQVTALGVEPRISLLPDADGPWRVFLDLPDFTPLAQLFPELAEVLSSSRCTVVGSSRGPLARELLLSGRQFVRLARWPRSDEVLLKFERPTPHLDFLLSTECLLRPGPVWLLGFQADGRARELRTKVSRPGRSYVLLADPSLDLDHLGEPVSLSCEGVSAVRIDLPDPVPPDIVAKLSDLGVTVVHTVAIWPAGLPPAGWDAQGTAEVIAGDRSMLALRADHEIESVALSLDGMVKTLHTTPMASGEPIYVEVPGLPAGSHVLSVLLRSPAPHSTESIGELELIARDAHPWSGHLDARSAMTVLADPVSPTLNQFWSGDAKLAVDGPAGSRVKCTVVLIDAVSEGQLVQKRFNLKLPVTNSSWENALNREFREKSEVRKAYDVAGSATVEIDGSELGRTVLSLEREFEPVRFVLRTDREGYALRMLHETESELVLTRCLATTPDYAEPLPLDAYEHDFVSCDKGALYFVEASGKVLASVVVPPPVLRVTSLADLAALQPSVRLRSHARTPVGVDGLVKCMERWAQASLPGNLLAKTMRDHVLKELNENLGATLGGPRWGRAERDFLSNPKTRSVATLATEISDKRQHERLTKGLVDRMADLASRQPEDRVVLFLTLTRELLRGAPIKGIESWELSDLDWLAQFALRACSSPESARSWAGDSWDDGISDLLAVPIFVRAARFVVLGVSRIAEQQPSTAGGGETGWQWS